MNELEAVAYQHGEVALTGWLGRPTGVARAAILILPTIANANAAVKQRATMLAERGYLALVADFYGDAAQGAPADLAQGLRADVSNYRARLAAALDVLRNLPEAASIPVGAIGYCMGGQAALELAREGHPLFAAVSFHGLLTTDRPAQPGVVKARLLICHGDADPLVPREQVLAFWDEMDAADANWHFHSYSGVRHGFTDPASDGRGIAAIAYDASADRQSWAAMINLFDELLG